LMRVTNTGAGDSFLVEDAANPDASNFKIDANGFIYTGSLLSTIGSSGRMQILDSQNALVECIAGSTAAVTFGASTTGNRINSSMGAFNISTTDTGDAVSISPSLGDGLGSSIYSVSDGSTLKTGINNSSPTEALDVTGNIKASGTVIGSNLSGTNTGDETTATIKTKLGSASSTQDGYLTSTDWTSFNSKMPFAGSVGYVQAVVASIAPFAMGLAAPSGTGTASAVTPSNTSFYTTKKILEYTASSLSSAIAGWRFTAEYSALSSIANVGGFKFSTSFGFQAGFTTNPSARRFFVGFTSSTVSPSDVNPSSLGTTQEMFGIAMDNGDANFQFMHSNGTVTATKIDLGSTFARPSANKDTFYRIDFHVLPGSLSVSYVLTNLLTGAISSGTISSNLPASGSALSPRCWISAGGSASAVGVAMEYIYLQNGA